MLVARADFEAVGGFDANYAGEYEDHDLLRKLATRGRKGVYAPRPRVLIHRSDAAAEAAVDIVDRALFVDTWYDDLLRGDPYFNPGFARQAADFVPSGWREQVNRVRGAAGHAAGRLRCGSSSSTSGRSTSTARSRPSTSATT